MGGTTSWTLTAPLGGMQYELGQQKRRAASEQGQDEPDWSEGAHTSRQAVKNRTSSTHPLQSPHSSRKTLHDTSAPPFREYIDYQIHDRYEDLQSNQSHCDPVCKNIS